MMLVLNQIEGEGGEFRPTGREIPEWALIMRGWLRAWERLYDPTWRRDFAPGWRARCPDSPVRKSKSKEEACVGAG